MSLTVKNEKNMILGLIVLFSVLFMMMVFGSVAAYAEEVPAEEEPQVVEEAAPQVEVEAPQAEAVDNSAVLAQAEAQEQAAIEAKAQAEARMAEQQQAAEEARVQAEKDIEEQKQAIEAQKAQAEAERRAAEEEIQRKKAEEEARKAAEETQRRFEESLSATGMSEADFNALCKIVQAEDGHDSIDGRIGVANVILNRVRSPLYPNSIMGVITAPGQFGPVRSGAFAAAIPSASTVAAVKEAVAGKNTVGNALYFHRGSSFGARTLVASIGAHSFFV